MGTLHGKACGTWNSGAETNDGSARHIPKPICPAFVGRCGRWPGHRLAVRGCKYRPGRHKFICIGSVAIARHRRSRHRQCEHGAGADSRGVLSSLASTDNISFQFAHGQPNTYDHNHSLVYSVCYGVSYFDLTDKNSPPGGRIHFWYKYTGHFAHADEHLSTSSNQYNDHHPHSGQYTLAGADCDHQDPETYPHPDKHASSCAN